MNFIFKLNVMVPSLLSILFILNRYSKIPKENFAPYLFCCFIFSVFLFFLLRIMVKKIEEDKSNIFKLFFFFGMISLPFLIVYYGDYWPHNHEAFSWRNRIVAYEGHFSQWDFIPYWSSGEAQGFGAPLPVYYHKLFYWVSAFIYLIFRSVKDSVVLSLAMFSAIGVVGMYKSFRLLGMSSWPSLFLGSCLLFQYYTLTDWFVRGAMSEFSALVLVPWIFWWCLNFIKTEKFSLSIALILILTFYAHNIIAYFGVFAICFAIGLVVIKNKFRISLLVHIIKKSLISTLIFFSTLVVYLIPAWKLSKYYNPNKILMRMSDGFKPLKAYFWDDSYTWQHCDIFTVQISPALWSFVILFIVLHIHNSFEKLGNELRKNKDTWLFMLFLLFSFSFYFILQSSSTLWFYESFPGAEFIQFAWRLLTFIQPVLLLVLGFLIYNYFKEDKEYLIKWVTGLFLICTLVSYPMFKNPPPTYRWFSQYDTEEYVNRGVFGIGEYMPDVKGIMPNDEAYYYNLSRRRMEIKCKGKCNLEIVPFNNPESLVREFRIVTDTNAEVILPINYSGLEKIGYINPNGSVTSIEGYRIDTDPRIRIKIHEGESRIKVTLPNFLNLFR